MQVFKLESTQQSVHTSWWSGSYCSSQVMYSCRSQR